jgi:hypothetical protein
VLPGVTGGGAAETGARPNLPLHLPARGVRDVESDASAGDSAAARR